VGLFEVKQAGRKFAHPYEIGVRIGRPMRFAADRDPAQIARELQAAVESLGSSDYQVSSIEKP
jgi:hypothetical protein